MPEVCGAGGTRGGSARDVSTAADLDLTDYWGTMTIGRQLSRAARTECRSIPLGRDLTPDDADVRPHGRSAALMQSDGKQKLKDVGPVASHV